jgi:hypothetical protein
VLFVSYQGIRPMKPLFVFVFMVSAAAVFADQLSIPRLSALPPLQDPPQTEYVQTQPGTMEDLAAILRTPPPLNRAETVQYTTKKPAETAVSLPSPLAPRLPNQNSSLTREGAGTVRGQTRTVDESSGLLSIPPSPAQGAVAEGTIDPKLIGNTDLSDPNTESSATDSASNVPRAGVAGAGTMSDPLGYGMLFAIAIITTMGLAWMAFVAYDYRQRWIQSLTVQNDRYLGGGMFDTEMEDAYSTSVSFSEGFGLPRRSI